MSEISSSNLSPLKRSFLPLNKIPQSPNESFRLCQFNMLADGLSGLRDDLGAFSRATFEDLDWENRKVLILNEITQHSPDIITMQENDHFYDYFLHEMSKLNYLCLYSPKPASACLEVSDRSDGVALFLSKNKFNLISSETLTYALSNIDIKDPSIPSPGDGDTTIKTQNQVAIIAVCELANQAKGSPPLIIATTHLKASKTAIGEKFRQKEAQQLLNNVYRIYKSYDEIGKTPAVLVTGDLNALPDDLTLSSQPYEPLTYRTIKSFEPLKFRSVLNDDLVESGVKFKGNNVFTTWKSRIKQGVEIVLKHCIDYIFYVPFNGNDDKKTPGLIPYACLDLLDDNDVGEKLIPSTKYPSDHISIIADFYLQW